MDNQKVNESELKKIRCLDDFDLVMLISEIHDNGWDIARITLKVMPPMEVSVVNSIKGEQE
jgi:hypothetical protein